VNAYLQCLLSNLICAFILSRFRKSRPWNRFLWIVLRFYSAPSEGAEVGPAENDLRASGPKGL